MHGQRNRHLLVEENFKRPSTIHDIREVPLSCTTKSISIAHPLSLNYKHNTGYNERQEATSARVCVIFLRGGWGEEKVVRWEKRRKRDRVEWMRWIGRG